MRTTTDAWIEIVRTDVKTAMAFYGSAPRFDLIVEGQAHGEFGDLGLTRRDLAKKLRELATYIASDEFLLAEAEQAEEER